jgi:hypothetical protein
VGGRAYGLIGSGSAIDSMTPLLAHKPLECQFGSLTVQMQTSLVLEMRFQQPLRAHLKM